MPSLTTENYVKAIYQICVRDAQEAASTGKIAELLGVAPGTVTSMLKTLEGANLAQYTPYEGVSLTASGQALAMCVLRRHRLMELFLVKTLDLSWDEVHEEAENLEHAVSETLINKIDDYLGNPTHDPHGDPIPQADGNMAQAESTPLLSFPENSPFRLVRVLDQSGDFLRFLSEVGLSIGAIGQIVKRSETAEMVTLLLEGNETPLSYSVCKKLLVAKNEENHPL
ncbi:MAG: metal-dependent transcriptional regulator [Pirellulaceae bacterium]|nr:metal-dependent transcriptional regulator [Pirellulaceae bacterium]